MESTTISRKDLFQKIKKDKVDRMVNFISQNFVSSSSTTIEFSKLESFCFTICNKFRDRWEKSRRTKLRFLQHNNDWLAVPIDLSHFSQNSTRRRPTKNFENCSQRSKRRKIKELTNVISDDQLIMAVETQMRSSGKRDTAGLVKELTLA